MIGRKKYALLFLLIGLSDIAFAQRTGYGRTGVEIEKSPFHPLYLLLSDYEDSFAQDGQEFTFHNYHSIALSITRRLNDKAEILFTAGHVVYHGDLVQYSQFGTDPAGKPRYSLDSGKASVSKKALRSWSATVMWRQIWTVYKHEEWYSAIGGVLANDIDQGILFFPSVTLLGFRYNIDTFYLFVENSYKATTTLISFGAGIHF